MENIFSNIVLGLFGVLLTIVTVFALIWFPMLASAFIIPTSKYFQYHNLYVWLFGVFSILALLEAFYFIGTIIIVPILKLFGG
jgi:hypothetical protein